MPRLLSYLFLLVAPLALQAQGTRVSLPAHMPLWVQSRDEVRLRVGQAIQGTLVYPVFAENKLVLPAGTAVKGTVQGLQADHAHRVEARLRADFTPFSHPEVRFSQIQKADGTWAPLPTGLATDGAPVLQLTPPPPKQGGFIHQQFDRGVAMAKDRLTLVTAPGKAGRLRNLLYSQLPYHPQYIPAKTVWTVDTTQPMELAESTETAPASPASGTAGKVAAKPTAPQTKTPGTWTLEAYLPRTLSSATAHVGGPVRAVVARPVRGEDGKLAVPEGAVLQGEITRAKPARRFGRAGELSFAFHQLSVPGSEDVQQVQTSLTGIDADQGANLALDREGKVKPKPQDKIVVPAILLLLATRPLDRDGGRDAFGKNAVASNSLGVLGFIVGTAAQQPNVASGIGFYGTALAIWNRWIKRGEETTLRENTRVVVETTARRSAPMRAGQ